MSQVTAFDPGFGNTKVCLDGKTAVIQSAVTRPRSVGLAAIGLKSAVHVPHVCFGDQTFAAGSGVWHLGSLLSSHDFMALASMERRALFYATLASLLPAGEHNLGLLIVGLPVNLLQDQAQADTVLAGLKAYKGEHDFKVGHADYHLTVERLKVLAQPVGAYADWLLDGELCPRKNASEAEVAILDIGMNTLDLYAIHGGRVEPRFVGGGKVGVRRLLELLDANGHDLEELDAGLRAGQIKPPQSALDSWLGEILASVERTWPSLRRFTTVIPTGGGASVLGEQLRLALASKGAAVHAPADPVTANVVGLWKWGCHVSRR